MSEHSPWYYRAAAIAATAGLVGGAGYVIYKYALTPASDEGPAEEDKPPVSMQALLTGGAAGGASAASRSAAAPSLPVRKTPSPSGAAGAKSRSASVVSAEPDANGSGPSTSTSAAPAATAAKPVASNLKACACCNQPLSGLPQRCSQCKQVYYCTQKCQKQHWAEHKATCSKGSKPGSAAGSSAAAPAAGGSDGGSTDTAADGAAAAAAAAVPAVEAAPGSPAATAAVADGSREPVPEAEAGAEAKTEEAGDEEPEAEGEKAAGAKPEAAGEEASGSGVSGDGAGEAGAAAGSKAEGEGGDAAGRASNSGGLQGALVEVLRQAAEKGAGTLDGRFEEAVMHFLGGDLKTALAAFTALQADARKADRPELVLELHKWMGHTNAKLGNFTPAADAFQAGIDAAVAEGNTAARVDNSIGLGNLWKMAGQYIKAAEVLKEALVAAQEAESAGMQSEVLVALGNVVMAADPEEGLQCLQIAVKLREDEVAKAAETGDRAAMATGMMQAAAALVNLAAALFATRRFEHAKAAYEQAMEIFELMEDTDKVIQVLINLANLAELQLDDPKEALEYRRKLAAALKEAGHPGIAGGSARPSCGVCSRPIALMEQRAKGDDAAAVVLLGCLHVQHDGCFKEWCEEGRDQVLVAAGGVAGGAAAAAQAAAAPGAKRTSVCPTCRAPVPVMT